MFAVALHVSLVDILGSIYYCLFQRSSFHLSYHVRIEIRFIRHRMQIILTHNFIFSFNFILSRYYLISLFEQFSVFFFSLYYY